MPELRCPLNLTAEMQPDSAAVVTPAGTTTFAELEQLVHISAVNLKERGVARNSHVAVLGENSLDYYVLVLALLRIGAIFCAVNHRWPKRAVKKALNSLDCPILIFTKDKSKSLNEPSITEWQSKDIVPRELKKFRLRSEPVVRLDHPTAIIFTSGSCTRPKAALLSYGNFYYNAISANKFVPFAEHDRWLLSLPLCHVGGLGILFRSIIGGGAVAIPDIKQETADVINKFEISHTSFVPTQFHRLLNSRQLGSLNRYPIVILGGAPAPVELIEQGLKAGFKIYTTYGLTEMASQVTIGKADNHGHSGCLLKHRELKIADDGEILVKGKTLFLGYVENGMAELPLDDQGWFHTSDIGKIDRKGRLTFLGRKDNMLISGGENIFPEEIESYLMQLSYVETAIVVGIKDKEFGERPVAFVKGSNGLSFGKFSDRLKKELEKNLPRYKIPVKFLNWPEPAVNGSLKPDRQKLTRLAQKEQQANQS
ncbi:MAG: o-succinylbenzoate--CoA ligase [candidate division Zixibacteria bacterium]|nr:o-succinylbenzoate--CoA ligase [candidate division Zixibacteria bacterium]